MKKSDFVNDHLVNRKTRKNKAKPRRGHELDRLRARFKEWQAERAKKGKGSSVAYLTWDDAEELA